MKKFIKILDKEHVAFGKARVKAEDAWLVILLAVGIFRGIATSAMNSKEFVLECAPGLCGGVWTHTVVNGELGAQIANAASAMPGIFLFILGGVSAAMIFGLARGKFNFTNSNKRKTAKRRSHRKRGFVSSEMMAVFFLTVLVSVVFTFPATEKLDAPAISAEAALVKSLPPEKEGEVRGIATTQAKMEIETVSEEAISSTRHWVALDSGVAKITAADIRDVLSIRKNGVEIWNREMLINKDASVNLNMELSVVISDTIDVVYSSSSAVPEIELNSFPGN